MHHMDLYAIKVDIKQENNNYNTQFSISFWTRVLIQICDIICHYGKEEMAYFLA